MSDASPQLVAPRPAEEELPWYQKKAVLILGVAAFGPLALPLVWIYPWLKWYWKLCITLAVIGLTWGCLVLTKVMIAHLIEQWDMIQELL